MIKRLLIMSLVVCTSMVVQAQTRTVSGKITDEADGSELPGVNVLVKGTSNGTVTDMNGTYSIEVSETDVLVFSFIGYVNNEQTVGSRSVLDVQLLQDTEQLDEVVVTALGISRDKKSLTYAAQEVDGDELTRVKDPNVMNSLTGKAAGLFVNKSGSGAGGSTRVVLRGNSSTRNNSVLYVIDGIPMNNSTPSQPNDVWGQNAGVAGATGTGGAGRDGGDGISNINPEDIESISVLKGASAAALYGSQAANGVILITTKKGKAGAVNVSLSSNFTSESVLIMPELQYEYGQTIAGALDSWGSKVDAKDHATDYFDNGRTWINTVSVSGGNEMAQSYFSYAHTDSKGILPSNGLNRHNLTFKENLSLWQDRVKLDGSVSLISQKAENRAVSGMYFNPLTGLYFFPRGLNFDDYANNYETFDAERNFNVQNWPVNIDVQQNPNWILNRNQSEDSRNRVIGSIGASIKITENLNLRVRGNIDKSIDRYEQKAYASTQSTLADFNGRYVQDNTESTQLYGDAFLNYNKTFESFSVSATLGTSITDVKVYKQYFDSKGGDNINIDNELNDGGATEGLYYPNVFNLQNIAIGGTALFNESGSESQLQALFGSLNLGYKGMLFLDVTGRNDWSSTLPETSFFYPSVGLTAVISEMVDFGSNIDLVKVRGSFAQVGNGVNAYDIGSGSFNNIVPYGTAQIQNSRVEPGQSLSPEIQTSFEVGAELGMFARRVSLDLAYYNTLTKDQRIPVVAPDSQGGGFFYINGGEIQNSGIEAALTLVPVQTDDFKYTTTFNFTANRNEVKELPSDVANGKFQLTAPGVNNYAMIIEEGSSFGDIYGRKFARDDQGRIIVDADGKPQADPGEEGDGGLGYVGNPNPDFMLGWNNSFTYKGINLSFLIDGRFGGQVMSITEAMNDLYGVSQTTADARNAGGVDVEAVLADGTPYSGLLPAQSFYTTVGGRDGITEQYVYDATNIRLRELSIGYSIPSTVMSKMGPLKTARFSVVGRNLFFFMNNAPFDPDVSMSTGTGLQGVHVFAMPSTRSLGFNLSITL